MSNLRWTDNAFNPPYYPDWPSVVNDRLDSEALLLASDELWVVIRLRRIMADLESRPPAIIRGGPWAGDPARYPLMSRILKNAHNRALAEG